MKKKITAKQLEDKFDRGEDVSAHLDITKARRANKEPKRVNVDFPPLIVSRLDKEAARIGVTRQALVKIWIAQRLDEEERMRA